MIGRPATLLVRSRRVAKDLKIALDELAFDVGKIDHGLNLLVFDVLDEAVETLAEKVEVVGRIAMGAGVDLTDDEAFKFVAKLFHESDFAFNHFKSPCLVALIHLGWLNSSAIKPYSAYLRESLTFSDNRRRGLEIMELLAAVAALAIAALMFSTGYFAASQRGVRRREAEAEDRIKALNESIASFQAAYRAFEDGQAETRERLASLEFRVNGVETKR